MRVRNADGKASDGFSALLFAHKTLERLCERKDVSFFTKGGAHKQKHTKTRDDERQTNALFLGCYTRVVCVL